jgi:hypothetical protein
VCHRRRRIAEWSFVEVRVLTEVAVEEVVEGSQCEMLHVLVEDLLPWPGQRCGRRRVFSKVTTPGCIWVTSRLTW